MTRTPGKPQSPTRTFKLDPAVRRPMSAAAPPPAGKKGPIRVRVSLRRVRLPPPGVLRREWAWEDVLGEERPRQEGRPAFVVRHGLDDDPDPEARLAYATLVHVDGDALGEVDVEERVVAEARLLSGVLRAERVVSRRLERGSRAGVRLVESGSHAISRRVGGRSAKVIDRGGGLLASGVEGAGGFLRRSLRALAEAPDMLLAGAGSAEAHLHAPGERRAFLQGMLEPRRLSREGKAAGLVLAVLGIAALAILVTVAVVLVSPGAAAAWRALLLFFLLGIGSTTLFPFFPETRLDEVARVAGGPAAIGAVALGMTVGAWLVLFLGDEAHAALRRSVRPGSPLARLLDRAESFAARWGFWAIFLVLCIPLGPDTPVFYVAATVGTPARSYLAGALLGTLVRFSLWHYWPILF